MPRCIGLLDGIKRFMARPGGNQLNQQACYSEQKRPFSTVPEHYHARWLVLYMYVPEEGLSHDMRLYRKSGLDNTFRTLLVVKNEQYYAYGNGGFVITLLLQIGMPSGLADESRKLFNLHHTYELCKKGCGVVLQISETAVHCQRL